MGDSKEKPAEIDPFSHFVKGLLETYSALNSETIDILTDDTGLPVFKTAFTSETVSRLDNYEQLEFIGDTIMNDVVALFIFNKYPKYVVAWLTLIKHSVISSLGLSKLAEFLGFWDNKGSFIQYNGNKEAKKEQLLEDVLEAFVGALRQIVDSKATVLCGEDPPFGLGTVITQKFIFSALAAMEKSNPDFISDSWVKVKDPKTRIKELMTKYKLGSISKNLTTQTFNNRWVSTLILYHPIPTIKTKTFTATSFSSKRDA